MTQTSTALTLHRASTALSKETKSDYWNQAKALLQAGMFPEKFENAEQAFMVALFGHELGLSPQRAWKQIHLIKGQPALEVHLQVAKVREAIPGLIWKITEHTDKICTITHGRTKDDLQETSFTWEEAESAQLTGPSRNGKPSNWMKDPKSMLYARAAGRAVRWFYPETQGGGLLHNVDEMRDALEHEPAAPTLADKVEEARTGDGRMPKAPKDAKVVDVTPEPVNAGTPSDEPPATPPPAETTEQDPALKELAEILAAATDLNGLDRAYGTWRGKHTAPVLLIQGYDLKEARQRELQTKA